MHEHPKPECTKRGRANREGKLVLYAATNAQSVKSELGLSQGSLVRSFSSRTSNSCRGNVSKKSVERLRKLSAELQAHLYLIRSYERPPQCSDFGVAIRFSGRPRT
jgi:hypothetical protein